MKKTLSLLSLVVFLMTACFSFASADAEKLSPVPVELELMAYEHASVPWLDDPISLDAIFEATNIRLKVTAVPQSDYSTKVNLLLGTNQMPDIVKTEVGGYNLIKNYAASGIYLDLSDYMEEYAPNYYEIYKNNPNVQMYDFEGSTYGFVLWGDKTNVPAGPALVYRYDLFEKHDIALPTTWEELLTAMTKLKEIYPDSQPWTSRGSTTSLFNRAGYLLGSGYNMYYEPETGKWEFAQITESFPKMLDYLNRAYEAGVLDIDYATMNNQLWQEKMNTGKSFMYVENPGFAQAMTTNLQVTDPDADLGLAPLPANSITGTARARLYDSPEDAFFLISADVENPELVVKFFDWCYTDEGAAIINFGKLGETFKYGEDGQPELMESFAKSFESVSVYDIQSALGGSQLGFAPRFMTDMVTNSYNKAHGIATSEYIQRQINLFMTDPGWEAGVIKPPFTEEENETISEILSPINTYLATQYDKFITGEAEISEWAAVVEEIKKMNIQEVIDIYNEAYDRATGK